MQTKGLAAVGTSVSEDLVTHCVATKLSPGQSGPFTAITKDPDYGIRAWMAVVSYLALDPDFLFEW